MFANFSSRVFCLSVMLFTLHLAVLIPVQTMAFSPRTVAIQMFEWPWQDIARECEIYLGPSGFSAVQVSPPHEHVMWENHPWWERYQVVSYNLISRSGNEAQFIDMVKRCHAVGIDIYVDAVLNHTTGLPGGRGFGDSDFSHYAYSSIFGYSDFHHCGRNGNDDIQNFNDRYELQNCELLDLADLKTESDKVRNTLASYLNHLLDLGVNGFRLDAAKHIPAEDLLAIKGKLKRSAYFYEEIIYDSRGPVQYSEYLPVGDVMAYNYGFILASGFLGKNTYALYHVGDSFPASDNSVVFLTNHDLERENPDSILSFNSSNQPLYRLAQIFMLAWPFGYPFLYSGYDFHSNFNLGPPLSSDNSTTPILDGNNQCRSPWTCEHRLPEIPPMVDFRNQTNNSFHINNWWSNGYDALAFTRGTNGFISINFSNHQIQQEFLTSLDDGNYCNILDENYNLKNRTCDLGYRVQNGRIRITMPALSAFVLLKQTTIINSRR